MKSYIQVMAVSFFALVAVVAMCLALESVNCSRCVSAESEGLVSECRPSEIFHENPSEILSEITAEDYSDAIDYFWCQESRRGLDKSCWQLGSAGEYGEFQITPIFVRDVERISGYRIRRWNSESCRKGIRIWLEYYAPRAGAVTVEELYKLYRYGPTGYREN